MIDSSGPVSTFFSNTITQKKGLIPIRSVLYRKESDPITMRKGKSISNLRRATMRDEDYSHRLSAERNLDIVKDGYNRTSVFYKHFNDIAVQNVNVSASTDANSNIFAHKPNLTVTLHKLGAQSRIINSKPGTSSGTKNMTKLKKITRNPDDYMNLLFDETRTRFRKEDYEEVVDINPVENMQRLYSLGFRDPEYYSSRQSYRLKNVLSEEEIRTSYNFKLPALVSSMENPNTLTTHVLGPTNFDLKYLTDEFERIKLEEESIKGEKEEIKASINKMKEEHQKELDDTFAFFKKQAEDMMAELTNDFHENQNTTFKLVKEISRLEREKIIIEGEIEHCTMRMNYIEDKIYGRPMFNIEPVDEDKARITQMNLRGEDKAKLTHTKIVH